MEKKQLEMVLDCEKHWYSGNMLSIQWQLYNNNPSIISLLEEFHRITISFQRVHRVHYALKSNKATFGAVEMYISENDLIFNIVYTSSGDVFFFKSMSQFIYDKTKYFCTQYLYLYK